MLNIVLQEIGCALPEQLIAAAIFVDADG